MLCHDFIGSNPPGSNRGIPTQLMRRNNHTPWIDPSILPPADDAVRQYEQFGGNITQFTAFGQDPLNSRADLVHQREAQFYQHYPGIIQSLDHFFTNWSMEMLTCSERDSYSS